MGNINEDLVEYVKGNIKEVPFGYKEDKGFENVIEYLNYAGGFKYYNTSIKELSFSCKKDGSNTKGRNNFFISFLIKEIANGENNVYFDDPVESNGSYSKKINKIISNDKTYEYKEIEKMQDRFIDFSSKLSEYASTCFNKQKEIIEFALENSSVLSMEMVDINDHQSYVENGIELKSSFWTDIKYNYVGDNPISIAVFVRKSESLEPQLEVTYELTESASTVFYKTLYDSAINKVINKVDDYSSENLKWYYVPKKNDKEKAELKNLDQLKADSINAEKRIRISYIIDVKSGEKYKEDEEIKEEIKDGIDTIYSIYDGYETLGFVEGLIDNGLNQGDKQQIILTGAPGTGKTYGAKEYVKLMCPGKEGKADANRYRVVQFHPSYDYTDFVEGIRPVNINSSSSDGANSFESKKEMSFVKLDGEFKAFCRHVVEHNLCKVIDDGESEIKKDKKIKQLFDAAENEKKLDAEKDKELINELNLFRNNEEKFYFIIDEINRADLSKVFGELMYGLEYRGIQNRFPTQYSQLDVTYHKDGVSYEPYGFDCFKDGFFIPENVVIIGTMNDIDKSVESFDYALRRRFQWIEVNAKDVMELTIRNMMSRKTNNADDYSIQIETLIDRINAMNDKIVELGEQYGLTKEYCIGPALFKDYELKDDKVGRGSNPSEDINANSLEKIFNYSIRLTLLEYVRGRRIENVEEEFINPCKNALLGK